MREAPSLSNLHFRPHRHCTRVDCMKVSRQRAPRASGGSFAARFRPNPNKAPARPLTACDGGERGASVGRGGRGAAAQRGAPERPRRARCAQRALARRRQPCPAPRRGAGAGSTSPPAVEAEGGASAGRGGGSTRSYRAGPSRAAKAPPSGAVHELHKLPMCLGLRHQPWRSSTACWGPTSDQHGPHRSRSTFSIATGPLRRPHALGRRDERKEAETVARRRAPGSLSRGDNEPISSRP